VEDNKHKYTTEDYLYAKVAYDTLIRVGGPIIIFLCGSFIIMYCQIVPQQLQNIQEAVDKTSAKLPQNMTKIFHTFVMQGMLLCKCTWQNMLPGIIFLASTVKELNQGN
jgi:glucose uptake protein GlcU